MILILYVDVIPVLLENSFRRRQTNQHRQEGRTLPTSRAVQKDTSDRQTIL